MRRKEDQVSGVIWDSLPVTEKEKDEIAFQNLNAEVGQWDTLLLIFEQHQNDSSLLHSLKLR